MSRITIDHNKWGQGDLNGNPSSVKTNGTSIKRFGPLGAAGSAGHVKNHGGEHEVVFELDNGRAVLKKKGNSVQNIKKYVGFLSHLKGKKTDNVIDELRGSDDEYSC